MSNHLPLVDTNFYVMEIIKIESEAYQRLIHKLDNLEKSFVNLKKQADTPLGEKWMGNEEVCQLLSVSKRTLQNYRDENLLPFSQINHKIYYRASDIERFLKKNYKRIKNF